MSEHCPRCGDSAAAALPSAGEARRLAAGVYIAPHLKAGGDVYEQRLAACASCPDLRADVLCPHCGCFVQFRARPKDSRCPRPGGGRWG